MKEVELFNDTNEVDVIKEEVKLQFHWYLFSFFMIYLISFLFPGIIFMLYVLLVFVPYFLEVTSIISVFTELKPLLSLALMPCVMIFCYFIHMVLIAVVTKILWAITEDKSPTKPGIIPRNIQSKILNYYHIRSFMIKYPKYVFTKGIFPWLSNWLYNYVGTSKIGKGTTIEEQVCADKFIDIGKNCYFGPNCVLTSHLVEGIFGNIAYFEIKAGDNVTAAGLNCIAPGTEIKENSFLLPMASTAKFSILKEDNYYFGIPLRKIFRRKITEYLDISKKELKLNETSLRKTEN